MLKTLAPALILTAAGLALIAIATIVMLEARPSTPPAGSVTGSASFLPSVAGARGPGFSAANNAALPIAPRA